MSRSQKIYTNPFIPPTHPDVSTLRKLSAFQFNSLKSVHKPNAQEKTATHAQKKAKEETKIVSLRVGDIQSEARRGRDEEDEEQLQSTVGNNAPPSEVCLCGHAAKGELFTAYLLIVPCLCVSLFEHGVMCTKPMW